VAQVIGIYIIRNILQQKIGSLAQTAASILNSIVILVFNLLYNLVAQYMTNRENHRTDTAYEDSMIAKLFLFQVGMCVYPSIHPSLDSIPRDLMIGMCLSAIVCTCCWQFVNSYASFFYIAFAAPFVKPSADAASDWQGDCGAVTCMTPLAINVAIIFGMNVTIR
jgi:uncharacterized membrane protein